MATYAVVQECADLRRSVQGLWKEVAFNALNSAVAGAVSNMAISMVKQTATAVFVEYPGHDSYETIMNTITRGDREKAQNMFSMNLYRTKPGSEEIDSVREVKVDIHEEFLIHCYQDLLDFIHDFQKTRTGKPTKPMLAQIKDWDPHFNLQSATKEQRLKLRRSYTINWLYDLVNIFSSIVVQRNTPKGETHLFERVDWSTSGPWDERRRLFGLCEFAGDVTSWAMQKQGTDIRHKILPHHVFQLQCIVDSMTVSRGWSLSSFKGHRLKQPARRFRPRRDMDLFLDRENKNQGKGYLQAVDMLRQILQKDSERNGHPTRYRKFDDMPEGMQYDFINWLGETMYKCGLQTIPPSRFSNTTANGLWAYSHAFAELDSWKA